MTWQFSYLRAVELMNARQREADDDRLASLSRAYASDHGLHDSRPLVSRVAATLAGWTGRRRATDASVGSLR